MKTSLLLRPTMGIAACLLMIAAPASGLENIPTLSRGGDGDAGAEARPITNGLRVFTCAHSFHEFVYSMLDEMAKSAGIMDHRSVGISSLGASCVIQHWYVPEDRNKAKAALRAGMVDVLTLSPIWLPDDGIEKFARLGLEYNPNIRVTIEEYWLPNDTYNPVYPLETSKYVDHDAATVPELLKQDARYRHDMDDYVRSLNRRLGRNVVLVVPVGPAAIALRERIIERKAPGLRVQWNLFRDMWGHPTAPLRVLATYCHFAVIYRRSPVGLPMPKDLLRFQEADPISKADAEALNRLLQELAWDAVIHNPLTGVTTDAAPQ